MIHIFTCIGDSGNDAWPDCLVSFPGFSWWKVICIKSLFQGAGIITRKTICGYKNTCKMNNIFYLSPAFYHIFFTNTFAISALHHTLVWIILYQNNLLLQLFSKASYTFLSDLWAPPALTVCVRKFPFFDCLLKRRRFKSLKTWWVPDSMHEKKNEKHDDVRSERK